MNGQKCIVRVTITIELELEPVSDKAAAQPRRVSDSVANRVLEAIHTLIEKGETPSPINIARALGINPASVTPTLRALVDSGTLYKGDKIGKQQPYYPTGREA